MSRKRDPARDEAKRIWLESGKKITLKEIANQLGKPPNRIRKWKSEDNWDGNNDGCQKEHSKGNVPNDQKERSYSKGTLKATKNSDLTPQQELFAQLVGGKRIPLYRAYQTAYVGNKPSLATAYVNASKLAKEPKVALRITKISESTAAEYDWSIPKVVDELTFVHDESKADMIANGVKKANADAMLQSVNSITDVLGLKASDREQIRRLKAEADLAAMRVTAANVNTNGQMESIDKLLNTIVQGSEQHDDSTE
ncbi:phage terminase small subunit-related protein [Secundilactobacillus muriivasis]